MLGIPWFACKPQKSILISNQVDQTWTSIHRDSKSSLLPTSLCYLQGIRCQRGACSPRKEAELTVWCLVWQLLSGVALHTELLQSVRLRHLREIAKTSFFSKQKSWRDILGRFSSPSGLLAWTLVPRTSAECVWPSIQNSEAISKTLSFRRQWCNQIERLLSLRQSSKWSWSLFSFRS